MGGARSSSPRKRMLKDLNTSAGRSFRVRRRRRGRRNEVEVVIPSPPVLEQIEEQSIEEEVMEVGDHQTESEESSLLPFSEKKNAKKISRFLGKHKICLCLVYQYAGVNRRTCDICNPNSPTKIEDEAAAIGALAATGILTASSHFIEDASPGAESPSEAAGPSIAAGPSDVAGPSGAAGPSGLVGPFVPSGILNLVGPLGEAGPQHYSREQSSLIEPRRMMLNFYVELDKSFKSCPLLISETMTVLQTTISLSMDQNIEHWHTYSLGEYCSELQAMRVLEENELVAEVKGEHMKKSSQNLVFVYFSDVERWDFLSNKKDYFIHPMRLMKVNDNEPVKIQIEDSFYHVPYDELDNSDICNEPIPETCEKNNKFLNPTFCSTIYIRINPIVSPTKPSKIKAKLSKSKKKGKAKGEDKSRDENELRSQSRKQQQEDLRKRERGLWKKKHMLLRDRHLYFAESRESMLKYYYCDKDKFREKMSQPIDKRPLELVGALSEFEVFKWVDSKTKPSLSLHGGIYLVKKDPHPKKMQKILFCCENPEEPSNVNNITRKLWLAALKVCQQGVRVEENFRIYVESALAYTNKVAIKRDMSNPRVAMDFSYGIGRVVDDPKEAAAIAKEARTSMSWIGRYHPMANPPKDCLKFGPHLKMNYYHGKISRIEAEKLVVKKGSNGAFILRDSNNRPGCLVITYFYDLKPYHQYVMPVMMKSYENAENIYLATCDKNIVFFDVHSLIEYHRLNIGNLHTTLGRCVKNSSRKKNTPPRNKLKSPSRKFSLSFLSPSRSRSTPVSPQSFSPLRSPASEGSRSPRRRLEDDDNIFSQVEFGRRIDSMKISSDPGPSKSPDLLTSSPHSIETTAIPEPLIPTKTTEAGSSRKPAEAAEEFPPKNPTKTSEEASPRTPVTLSKEDSSGKPAESTEETSPRKPVRAPGEGSSRMEDSSI